MSSLRDFTVIQALGKGSYGSVSKVQRKSDNIFYAMKEINIRKLSQREREDALNEIRILASIKHRNIVRYCDAFLERDNLYIVMEFAEHGDIGRQIEKFKKANKYIKEETIWSYCIQICRSLHELHSRSILHRDLKPKNVFLTGKNHVRLGDLGCAKLMKTGLARTQIGTPYYMSPEIWANRPYDHKSDMWALGCLLYELAMLQPPFLASDMNGLAQKVKTAPAARISKHYSDDLANLVASLLNKDPRMRPDTRAVLSMPAVASRLASVPVEEEGMWAGDDMRSQLIATIRAPAAFGFGARPGALNLPAPCYPKVAAGGAGGEGGVSPTGTEASEVSAAPAVPVAAPAPMAAAAPVAAPLAVARPAAPAAAAAPVARAAPAPHALTSPPQLGRYLAGGHRGSYDAGAVPGGAAAAMAGAAEAARAAAAAINAAAGVRRPSSAGVMAENVPPAAAAVAKPAGAAAAAGGIAGAAYARDRLYGGLGAAANAVNPRPLVAAPPARANLGVPAAPAAAAKPSLAVPAAMAAAPSAARRYGLEAPASVPSAAAAARPAVPSLYGGLGARAAAPAMPAPVAAGRYGLAAPSAAAAAPVVAPRYASHQLYGAAAPSAAVPVRPLPSAAAVGARAGVAVGGAGLRHW